MKTQRKSGKSYVVSKSLAALLPIITWNVENMLNELDELAKKTFRQSGEDAN